MRNMGTLNLACLRPSNCGGADKLVGCTSSASTRAAPRPSRCSPTPTAASSSEGRAGGANLQTEGELEVEKVLHAVIDQATGGRDVTLVGRLPRHGRRRSRRRRPHHSRHHAAPRLSRRTRSIVNDALIALVAGAGASPGVVVISGTGSIAYGVSHHGVAARAGGWGPTLGDEGSGYWIGRRALAAVMRDADGRGPRTAADAARPRAFLSCRGRRSWCAEIYHQPQGRRAIAALGAGGRPRARGGRSGGRSRS